MSAVKSFADLGNLVTVKDDGLHLVKVVETSALDQSTTTAALVETPPTSITATTKVASNKFDIANLGTLGERHVEDPEVVTAFRQAVDARIQEIKNLARSIGGILANPANLEYQSEAVAADEAEIIKVICRTQGPARNKFAVAFLDAMVEFFPATPLGLNHLANNGVAIGYFRPLDQGEQKAFAMLPLSTSDGKISWTPLTSSGMDASRILKAVTAKSAVVRKAYGDQKREQASGMATDTIPLLDAIATQKGEAVVYRPARENAEGRKFPETRMRITIGNGQFGHATVTVLAALGNSFTEGLVGVSIPFASIEADRFDRATTERFSDEILKRMVAVRKTIQEGIAFAKSANARNNDLAILSAAASILIDDFDRGTIGTALARLEKWDEYNWTQDGNGKWVKGKLVQAHNNVPFVVERSATGEIRVAQCLKQHKSLFARFRDFLPEKSGEEALKGVAYGGLGILGAMLRTVHYGVEHDRRKEKDASH